MLGASRPRLKKTLGGTVQGSLLGCPWKHCGSIVGVNLVGLGLAGFSLVGFGLVSLLGSVASASSALATLVLASSVLASLVIESKKRRGCLWSLLKVMQLKLRRRDCVGLDGNSVQKKMSA